MEEFQALTSPRSVIGSFSPQELNQAILELRDRINQRPFRKRERSRGSQFAAPDKPALNPLPTEPFDLSQWSRARVNIDYHIAFETNYYSAPYNLVHELVEVRSTATTIEISHKGQRVASHLRARGHGHSVTIKEHRPHSNQAHLEWTPSRMVHLPSRSVRTRCDYLNVFSPTSPTRRWATAPASVNARSSSVFVRRRRRPFSPMMSSGLS